VFDSEAFQLAYALVHDVVGLFLGDGARGFHLRGFVFADVIDAHRVRFNERHEQRAGLVIGGTREAVLHKL
jgi:hypothetical protein